MRRAPSAVPAHTAKLTMRARFSRVCAKDVRIGHPDPSALSTSRPFRQATQIEHAMAQSVRVLSRAGSALRSGIC